MIVGKLSQLGYSKSGEFLWYFAVIFGLPMLVFLAAKFFAGSGRGGNEADDSGPLPSLFRSSVLTALGAVLVYALSFDTGIDGLVDFYHEGERLAPLHESLSGGLPYKDIYVQHGLFANIYAPRAAAALFGPTVEGLRRFGRLVDPLAYVALFVLGARLLRTGWVGALMLFAICSGRNFWIGQRYVLALFSLAVLAAAVDAAPGRKRNVLCAGAGALAALSFFQATDAGLYALAASAVFGAFLGRAPLAYFCSGAFLASLPLVLFFLGNGIFDEFLRNVYEQCAYQLPIWGLPFFAPRELFPSWSAAPDLSGFLRTPAAQAYFPLAVLSGAGIFLALRAARSGLLGSPFSAKVLLMYLAASAAFRTALGRSDAGHVIDGAAFIWPLAILLAERALFTAAKIRRPARAGFAGLAAGVLLYYAHIVHEPAAELEKKLFRLPVAFAQRPRVPEPLPGMGRIAVPAAQVNRIKAVIEFVAEQSPPGEPIFDFSNQGAFYFFTGRRSVSRFHQALYAATPSMQEEIVARMEEEQPRVVISKSGTGYDAPDGIPMEERLPILGEYLKENYAWAVNLAGTEVLLRRGSR